MNDLNEALRALSRAMESHATALEVATAHAKEIVKELKKHIQ